MHPSSLFAPPLGKKVATNAGIRVAILVTVILAAGCRDHSQDVVVIEKTGSYHTEECPRVKMANTEIMPLSEAKALHFKPCPKCKPHEND